MTHAQKVYLYESMQLALEDERMHEHILNAIGTYGLEHLSMGLVELKKEIDWTKTS